MLPMEDDRNGNDQCDSHAGRNGDIMVGCGATVSVAQDDQATLRNTCTTSLTSTSLAVGRQCMTDESHTMSLSSVIRIEESLAREVSVVRDGSHIALTSEDIQRIHDPNVLRFLQENSMLFAKYMHVNEDEEENEGDDPRDATVSSIASHDTASLARETAQLRRDIDTFITAVDTEGRQYQICLDQHGSILIPLEDDNVSLSSSPYDDVARAEGGRQTNIASSPHKSVTLPADNAGELVPLHDAPVTSLTQVEETLGRTQCIIDADIKTGGGLCTAPRSEEWDTNYLPTDSSAATYDGTACIAAIEEPRTLQDTPFATPSTTAQLAVLSDTDWDGKSVSRETSGDAKAALNRNGGSRRPDRVKAAIVRPQASLQPHEGARVADLMRTDFVFDEANTSPFTLTREALERVGVIDRQLATLQLVRGPLWPESIPDENDTSDTGHAVAVSVCSTSLRPAEDNPRALGNMYMKEVQRRQRYTRAVHAINARLIHLHREVEQLNMRPGPTVMDDAQWARPRWALADTSASLAVDDTTMHDLLVAARDEEERATTVMHETTGAHANTSDPLAALRRDLAELIQRVTTTVDSGSSELPHPSALTSSCDDETNRK